MFTHSIFTLAQINTKIYFPSSLACWIIILEATAFIIFKWRPIFVTLAQFDEKPFKWLLTNSRTLAGFLQVPAWFWWVLVWFCFFMIYPLKNFCWKATILYKIFWVKIRNQAKLDKNKKIISSFSYFSSTSAKNFILQWRRRRRLSLDEVLWFSRSR